MTKGSAAKTTKTRVLEGGKLAMLRLASADEESLRHFFCDADGQAGLKSNFGDMIQRIAELAAAGEVGADDRKAMRRDMFRKWREEGYSAEEESASTVRAPKIGGRNDGGMFDPHARMVEPEMLRSIARDRAVYRRLLLMIERGQSKDVTILHRFYGPRPPGEDRKHVFGEMQHLVEYTKTVAFERADAALDVAIMYDANRRHREAEGASVDRLPLVKERIAALTKAIKALDSEDDETKGDMVLVAESARLKALREERRTARRFLAKLTASPTPAEVDAFKRHKSYAQTYLSQANREVTTADVVRERCKVDVVKLSGELVRDHSARVKEREAEIATWATPVIAEATELLIQACNAYRSAVVP